MVIIYIMVSILANVMLSNFGAIMIPINSFFLISIDMVLRDRLHDKWKGDNMWLKMAMLILISGTLSNLFFNVEGIIAIASFSAFFVSSMINAFVYNLLISKTWMVRSNLSNVVGSIVDSLLFPLIAFGVLFGDLIIMQLIAKLTGSFFWSNIFKRTIKSCKN